MKLFKIIIIITSICTSITGIAQIGVNTLVPDPTAALDIYPNANSGGKMGILIPRLGEATRMTMTIAAKGLMVYDTTNKMFYVNLTSGAPQWYAINPWLTKATATLSGVSNDMYTHSSVNNVGIGTNSPTARLDVVGDIKASSSVTMNTLIVPGFSNNALVPTGAIIMWSGSSAPAGWALCNGAGGTPDLRGRFIVSVGTNTAPAAGDINPNYVVGQTGGENTHKLTSTESGLPVHNHTSPPHSHPYYDINVTADADRGAFSGGAASATEVTSYRNTGDATVTVDNAAAQNALIAHENRPPYYVLAYIIKL